MIADRLLPLIGLLSASAWLACWTAGCVYGPQTGAWWGVPVVDEYGEMAARVPLSILGAVLSLGVTAAVMFWPEASWLKHTGRRAALGIGGITAVNFLLSLFRVDPAPVWWVLRWDSWFGLAFTMIALGVFFGLPHLSGTEGELSSS
jgi:prolipoprotein diacylglyceryltransferase